MKIEQQLAAMSLDTIDKRLTQIFTSNGVESVIYKHLCLKKNLNRVEDFAGIMLGSWLELGRPKISDILPVFNVDSGIYKGKTPEGVKKGLDHADNLSYRDQQLARVASSWLAASHAVLNPNTKAATNTSAEVEDLSTEASKSLTDLFQKIFKITFSPDQQGSRKLLGKLNKEFCDGAISVQDLSRVTSMSHMSRTRKTQTVKLGEAHLKLGETELVFKDTTTKESLFVNQLSIYMNALATIGMQDIRDMEFEQDDSKCSIPGVLREDGQPFLFWLKFPAALAYFLKVQQALTVSPLSLVVEADVSTRTKWLEEVNIKHKSLEEAVLDGLEVFDKLTNVADQVSKQVSASLLLQAADTANKRAERDDRADRGGPVAGHSEGRLGRGVVVAGDGYTINGKPCRRSGALLADPNSNTSKRKAKGTGRGSGKRARTA